VDYRDALAGFRTLGDSVWAVRTLLKIGLLSSSIGEREAGRDAWVEALDSALRLDATQLRQLQVASR
jgi:hypothetical protein